MQRNGLVFIHPKSRKLNVSHVMDKTLDPVSQE